MNEPALTLSQIGLYNPQRLSDDTIEKIFVARKRFFDFIVKKIVEEKPTSIPQHYLIIAQRGMGKSTFLKRMEVELRKDEYKTDFIPLLYPEEQYNLKSFAEFWLNTLDALADTLEQEKQLKTVAEIDIKVKELVKIKNQEELARETYKYFGTITQSLKRRPVLLVDNMSLIFDRMKKDEQHTFRAWLMKNGAPIVLGASAVAIEDTYDYQAPFYDAFQMHYLDKLSLDELLEILYNLAKLTHTEEIIPEIQNKIARIKTIHQLTGGNPRTAVMLFKIIIKGFSADINQDLEALLDEVTPIYKARFEELSEQMQIVIDAIALHWDPINLDQLRNETNYTNGSLSPLLKRLVEMGWIERIDAFQAKGNAYQISERFFNIWFLMRRSSRRQKRELYCLSKFIETLYGDELPQIAKRSLELNSRSCNHATYNLALSQVVKDETLQVRLREKSFQELREFASDNPDLLKDLEIPGESESVNNLLNQYDREIEEKNYINAEAILKQLLHYGKLNNEYQSGLLTNLGALYIGHLRKYNEAEKIYLKAIQLSDKNEYAYNGLATLYQKHLQKYEESEKYYLEAIKLNDKNEYAFIGLANLYQFNFLRYEDAEKMYLKVIQINPIYIDAYYKLGYLYQSILEKCNEAEKMYLIVLKLDRNYIDAYNALGYLYQTEKINYVESEKMYLKGIELNKNYHYLYLGLGKLYHEHLHKYPEAEKMYLNVIQIDENIQSSYQSLGNLYQDCFHNYNEAEKMYLKAIELDNTNNYPKYNLTFLYRDKLNQMEKAEQLFSTIDLEEELEDSYWLNKALFELYRKNEGIAKDYVEKALLKIDGKLPLNTQDDWWRFGGVVLKLGYSDMFLSILEDKGYDTILAPYYIAIKALGQKDTEGYLNSKAVELRDPTRKLIEMIQKFN